MFLLHTQLQIWSCCHARNHAWFFFLSPASQRMLLLHMSEKVTYFVASLLSQLHTCITCVQRKCLQHITCSNRNADSFKLQLWKSYKSQHFWRNYYRSNLTDIQLSYFLTYSTPQKSSKLSRCVMKTLLLWLSTMALACAKLALPVMMPQELYSHPLLDAQGTR